MTDPFTTYWGVCRDFHKTMATTSPFVNLFHSAAAELCDAAQRNCGPIALAHAAFVMQAKRTFDM